MNTNTTWREERLNDTTIRYVSEHTVTGTLAVTATLTDSGITWDKPDDVPVFIAERAAATLAA